VRKVNRPLKIHEAGEKHEGQMSWQFMGDTYAAPLDLGALLQKSAKPTTDNSPPIHRWDWAKLLRASP
jgi:hypothetical protein